MIQMIRFNHKKMVERMIEKRWCAADITALTGINHQTVRRYMQGYCSEISLVRAVLIADALDIPIQQMIIRESGGMK